MNDNSKFAFNVIGEKGMLIMWVRYLKNGNFQVRYPKYCDFPSRLTGRSAFQEMNIYQVGMLIFAHSISEFKRFEKEYAEFCKSETERLGIKL